MIIVRYITVVMILSFSFAVYGQTNFVCKYPERIYKAGKTNYPGDNNIDVKYYKLKLDIDPNAKQIEGITSIAFKVIRDNVSAVFFDLKENLRVDSVTADFPFERYDRFSDKVTIESMGQIDTGKTHTVKIYYYGSPARSGFGGFVFDNYNGRPWVWTLSEPYSSSDWWACKDDPSDKADSALIEITVPKYMFAVSNGKLISDSFGNLGRRSFIWKTGYPIANYLVAVTAFEFDIIRDSLKLLNGGYMEFTNYVRDSVAVNYRPYIKMTKEIFAYFTEIFGAYPFTEEKYGHVEFGYGGGMEHQTITSLGSWGEGIIAHELAHQWFGDKITCANWHEIWLNEGFAQYAESLYREHKSGFQEYLYRIKIDMNLALSAQGSVYVEDISGIHSIFNLERTYSKGAAVLHMLRGVVGDSAFFEIMKSYATDPQFAYSSATTEDFKSVAEKIYGNDLSWFFDEWIYGEGFPDYDYTYEIIHVNGGSEVKTSVYQNVIKSGGILFKMPVQLKFSGSGKDTIITVWVDSQQNDFEFNLSFRADRMIFDPNDFILKRSGEIPPEIKAGEDFLLEQNYPNPFASKTAIKFLIASESIVKLELFDQLGKRVAVLLNEIRRPGVYLTYFKSDKYPLLSNGVYFLRMSVNEGSKTRKIILLR